MLEGCAFKAAQRSNRACSDAILQRGAYVLIMRLYEVRLRTVRDAHVDPGQCWCPLWHAGCADRAAPALVRT